MVGSLGDVVLFDLPVVGSGEALFWQRCFCNVVRLYIVYLGLPVVFIPSIPVSGQAAPISGLHFDVENRLDNSEYFKFKVGFSTRHLMMK